MIDKNILFKYHQYLQENNSDISFNQWYGKNVGLIDEDEEITKEEILNKIVDEKNIKKGVKKIYGLFEKFYKDKSEYNDILN
jgi:hypothetical protein